MRAAYTPPNRRWPVILNALVEKLKWRACKPVGAGPFSSRLQAHGKRVAWCRSWCGGSVRARATALAEKGSIGYRAASHRGVDEDAVLGMRIGSCDRVPRAHRPGLSPVPLPDMRQVVQ